MEIELGYRADISIRIEDHKLLPNVLITKVLEDYGVEPLIDNLSREDIKEIILQLNDLYDGEFEITLKEI